MKKLTNKDLANLLKNDVKSFNAYREKYPNQKIDFTKLDDSINFKHSSLNHANLSNINIEGLNFEDSDMGKVQLIQSNINNCNFSRCNLSLSDLRGVKAKNTCFKYAKAFKCDFRGSDVELANFNHCYLHLSDFRNSNFNSYQKNDSFHSKEVYTNPEWLWDGFYYNHNYVSTLQLDKDFVCIAEERGQKIYEIGTYVFWVAIFFGILALRNLIVGSLFWATFCVVVFVLLGLISTVFTGYDDYRLLNNIISWVNNFDGFNFSKYFDEIETWKFRRGLYFGGFSLIIFLFFDII